jgi:hypothetical protein
MLIEDDIDSIKQNLENDDVWWLGETLRHGFTGYKNQTVKELTQEATERELI